MSSSGSKRPQASAAVPANSGDAASFPDDDRNAREANAQRILSEEEGSSNLGAASQQPRLLVVDDEPSVCRFVQRAAERQGFDVIGLTDPQSFLATLAEFRPHLLLLDLKMPRTDGIELLRQAAGISPQTRVVVMSGLDQRVLKGAEDFGRSSGLHIWGILKKPVRLEELKACFASAIEPVAAVTEAEFVDALANRELVLFYQPKISRHAKHWRVDGVEALVRWRHPAYGMLLPAQFLQLALRAGRMDELTEQVLEAGLLQAAAWKAAECPMKIAVNLPSSTFQNSSFPARFKELLDAHGLQGSSVMLEVTESAAMIDADLAKQVCLQLRVTGAGLSIDDFGTGYSSLRQLYELPFSELKVDRAFTASLPEDDEARKIVNATVGLAHALGMTVCAEGVETIEALEYIEGIGCDSAQGFLISRAIPPEAVVDFARAWNERAPCSADQVVHACTAGQ